MTYHENSLNMIEAALMGDRGPTQQLIATTAVDGVAAVLQKNSDYGSSVFHSPMLCPQMSAPEALLVRMSDKAARLANLVQSPSSAQVAESLDDTVLDLGNYCLLWLVARRLADKGRGE